MKPVDTKPNSQIACPTCDALYLVEADKRLTCKRCHRKLIVPARQIGVAIIATSILAFGLIFGVLSLPFVSVERFWITSEATIIQAALAFEAPYVFLSLIVLALVLLLPTVRLLFNLYVLGPLVLAGKPLPAASTAFRWSEILRPWSMAEIFALGCGVALFKITDVADVTIGPAFYMFAGLVIVLWAQERLICRFSVWRALAA